MELIVSEKGKKYFTIEKIHKVFHTSQIYYNTIQTSFFYLYSYINHFVVTMSNFMIIYIFNINNLIYSPNITQLVSHSDPVINAAMRHASQIIPLNKKRSAIRI